MLTCIGVKFIFNSVRLGLSSTLFDLLKANSGIEIPGGKHIFITILPCTKETKLREFQFKFLHRRIATNDFPYKIGIKQSDSCTFCREATENRIHLFWSSKYSNAFWKDCYQWIMKTPPK